MLHPNASNKVTCSVCPWERVVDPTRAYRSGHTHPTTMQECHEALVYEEVSPLPLEVYLLGEARPKMPLGEIQELLAGDTEDQALAASEQARNETLDGQIADLYELEAFPEPPAS